MTGGRPVRVTFPSYDVGAVDIIVAGKRAGIALDEGRGVWRAWLYPELTDRRIRVVGCEEVATRALRELRQVLRQRVESKGPWWAA